MRFVCFKSPFRPNFVRLCRRHPRGESGNFKSGIAHGWSWEVFSRASPGEILQNWKK
jgi:hypothetical protein